MPTNAFTDFADSPGGPAARAFAIVPHATDELETITKAIYVGGTGDVTVRPLASDTHVLFRNVPAGSILDIRVRAVRAAGTTATDIVGLA